MRSSLLAACSTFIIVASCPAAAQTVTSDFDKQAAAVRARIVVDPSEGLKAAARLRIIANDLTDEVARQNSIATADWLRAEALTRTNRASDALRVSAAAIPRAEQFAPSSKLLGDLVLAHGGASAATGDIQRALADYQSGFRTYQAAKEARGQAVALQNIASIYADGGDYAGALRYEQEATEAYDADPALQLTAFNTRGNALIELGRAREAATEYQRALAAARQLNGPLPETRVLQNLARSQVDARDYEAAANTLRTAYARAIGPAAVWRPALDGVAAMLALRQQRLDVAAAMIRRAFAEAGSSAAMMPLRDFHQTAYEIFRARGEQAEALSHLEAFKRLDDQKRAVTASARAALMSARFDSANKDAKIERASARLRNTIMIGLLIAASIVSVLLLIGFVSIRRSRNQVRDANRTLSTTNGALEKALAAKTEFLATTSHEIRTPLNGILGMTQVILADRTLAAGVRDRVTLVQGAGETMKALVDDILDIAKMETGEIRIHVAPTDLTRLLQDAGRVWTDQAQAKGLALDIDLSRAPAQIVADEVRLRQIVFNLMANAIKFTDRGTVHLIAAAEPAAGGGERLLVRIEDSGIGIPPDQLDAVFESFRQVDGGTTRRHGGSGLGLSICRNLARAMGGDVRVASLLGAGSTFTLDLPLQRIAPAVNAAHRVAERLADAELLLVEANPMRQGIMRAVLSGAVGSLHIVVDGAAARAALGDGGIDHVLADGASLDLALDAAQALAQACEHAGAHLTLLWPTPDEATRAALAEAGVSRIVAKPVSAPELLSALQKSYGVDMTGRDIAA